MPRKKAKGESKQVWVNRDSLAPALERPGRERAAPRPGGRPSPPDAEMARLEEQIATLPDRNQAARPWTVPQVLLALVLGIGLPCLALVVDPFLFGGPDGWFSDYGELRHYAPLAYVGLTLEVGFLAVWLVLQRLPALFAGIFAVGAFAYLILGAMLTPLIFLALHIGNILAPLGLWPLATAGSYAMASYWAWQKSRQSDGKVEHWTTLVGGLLLGVGIPVLVQVCSR